MFLSLKRKFSSAILNSLILLAFLIFCYLGKQVSDLYQQYQKAARLQTYLAELEELISITDKLKSGAQGVGEDFRLVNSAISSSLSINLKHDK